jgi:hypothetical protein
MVNNGKPNFSLNKNTENQEGRVSLHRAVMSKLLDFTRQFENSKPIALS